MSTLPIALLFVGVAFGAAPLSGPSDRPGDTTGSTVRVGDPAVVTLADRSVRLVVALGIVLGATFFLADLRLATAARGVDPVAVQSAAVAFPVDPVVAGLVAQSWTHHANEATGAEREAAIESSLDWSQRAVARQPDAPRWRDDLAVRFALSRRFDEAVRALGEALELQPQRPESLRLLRIIGDTVDDPSIEVVVAEMRCAAIGVDCPDGA